VEIRADCSLPWKSRRSTWLRREYERLVGPIPARHHLHHLCFDGRCVNLDHVVPVPAESHLSMFHRHGDTVDDFVAPACPYCGDLCDDNNACGCPAEAIEST
jgi:hypothetical protein